MTYKEKAKAVYDGYVERKSVNDCSRGFNYALRGFRAFFYKRLGIRNNQIVRENLIVAFAKSEHNFADALFRWNYRLKAGDVKWWYVPVCDSDADLNAIEGVSEISN